MSANLNLTPKIGTSKVGTPTIDEIVTSFIDTEIISKDDKETPEFDVTTGTPIDWSIDTSDPSVMQALGVHSECRYSLDNHFIKKKQTMFELPNKYSADHKINVKKIMESYIPLTYFINTIKINKESIRYLSLEHFEMIGTPKVVVDVGTLFPVGSALVDLETVGEGTFGAVKKGRLAIISTDGKTNLITKSEKYYIIKEFKGALTDMSEECALSYYQEIIIMKKLAGSKGSVKIYGQCDLIRSIIIECGDFVLKDVVKHPDWMDYGLGLVKAVSELHLLDLYHCDLKPDNAVLLNDKVKLIDFSSGMLKQGLTYVNRYGELTTCCPMTTLWWQSPDFFMKYVQTVDDLKTVDVWSVGCILLELVCGFRINGMKESEMITKVFELIGSPSESEYKELGFDMFEYKSLPFYEKGTLNEIVLNIPIKKFKSNSQLRSFFLDLLSKIFVYDNKKRITIIDILNHPFFTPKEHPKKVEECELLVPMVNLLIRNKRPRDILQSECRLIKRLATCNNPFIM